jgi:hypothetical protein
MYGRGHTKETENRSATETSENCYQTDWVEHVVLNGAAQNEETATKLQRNSRKTEKLNKPVFSQLRCRVVS